MVDITCPYIIKTEQLCNSYSRRSELFGPVGVEEKFPSCDMAHRKKCSFYLKDKLSEKLNDAWKLK